MRALYASLVSCMHGQWPVHASVRPRQTAPAAHIGKVCVVPVLLACAQVEQASQELEELREMKEDVERRERAQAAVIEHQAKRLDELETLYKVRVWLLSPVHAFSSPPHLASQG